MKTVEEIRRLRLGQLRERYGTLSELNEKLGLLRRDSTLSQVLNSSKSTAGKSKEMGSALARRLELALGLEVGWMDNDPAYDSPQQRLSQEAIDLAREFDRAEVHEREAMLTLWHQLLEVSHHGQGARPDAASQQRPPSGARA